MAAGCSQHTHIPRKASPYLQHNLVDGSSIRFKVEGLVVVVAEVGELKNGVTCETERIGQQPGLFAV